MVKIKQNNFQIRGSVATSHISEASRVGSMSQMVNWRIGGSLGAASSNAENQPVDG